MFIGYVMEMKYTRNGSCGRLSRIWEDNNMIDLREGLCWWKWLRIMFNGTCSYYHWVLLSGSGRQQI